VLFDCNYDGRSFWRLGRVNFQCEPAFFVSRRAEGAAPDGGAFDGPMQLVENKARDHVARASLVGKSRTESAANRDAVTGALAGRRHVPVSVGVGNGRAFAQPLDLRRGVGPEGVAAPPDAGAGFGLRR